MLEKTDICSINNLITVRMECFIPLPNINIRNLPSEFTNPFDYEPHQLCIEALEHLKDNLPVSVKMPKGKMYGVLIVKNQQGTIGMLVAYSGNEKEANSALPFVPQVYEITNPNGFFRKAEVELNQINAKIKTLVDSKVLDKIRKQLDDKKKESQRLIDNAKSELKKNKLIRDEKRKQLSNEDELAKLIKQSQREKSEFNKLKKQLKDELNSLEIEEKKFITDIKSLKQERKRKSAAVQKRIFDNYRFLNSLGEQESASSIFGNTKSKVPPAGAGDCSAPKLLQYAYLHQLTPVTMSEFWWGPSPITEIRKHGYFYPACKSKCEPILAFMLKGLSIEKQPAKENLKIKIIYEDEAIMVVNKPPGLLSVPGKEQSDSVYTQIKNMYPSIEGPIIIHRLDMSTSGILLLAKSKIIHEHLQKQFLEQTIKKRYVALLDGVISEKNGEINLPLRVDLNDRPRQMVCYEYGKEAITHWQVIEQRKNQTLIHFHPLTGRTHQLRVHSAHKLGLNTPIVGDPLYGKKSNRLMLHAEHIDFFHPIKKRRLSFTQPIDF